MITRQVAELRYSKIYQLLELKRYKDAMQEAQQLIAENPDEANAYAVLAQVVMRMEQYKDAESWSLQALKRDPDNRIAWFVRCVIFYEQQKWKELEQCLQEAQRVDPNEAFYFFLRANALNRKGAYSRAKEELLDGLELAPENALYLAGLSYTEALLGQVAASRQIARQALRLEVESYQVYLYLGWAAERRGDYDDYLLMLKNSVQLDPTDKQIRESYLEALQKNYRFYRILLAPATLLKRMKPWQVLLSWFIAWIVFKPLVILFIILYVLTHWTTKLLVHVKVFGWRRS
ncbi:tetratricopeptide repeat protein [Paenibacillus sp. HB172176]|uniref:tetratricopeptide repeat protein n=1 Tax=Paenibacillus sp. HB172176 TaxID=2493690 RepID=UPI00143AFCED|nr:tetratricopeptide repeat protein [Paenibacillus sp. HB172176]